MIMSICFYDELAHNGLSAEESKSEHFVYIPVGVI